MPHRQASSALAIVTNSSSPARLTRREMMQRALGVLGTILPASLAGAHPMARHLLDPTLLLAAGEKAESEDWKPEVFDANQNNALIAIAERVVPGSTKAQVNRVIDLLLGVETAENRQNFLSALATLNEESTRRFGRPAFALEAAQIDQLLSACSELKPQHPAEHDDEAASWKTNQTLPAKGAPNLRDHFENLKGWIVATYYSSEDGMRELGWTDEFFFEGPAGCAHPEGHS